MLILYAGSVSRDKLNLINKYMEMTNCHYHSERKNQDMNSSILCMQSSLEHPSDLSARLFDARIPAEVALKVPSVESQLLHGSESSFH